MSGPASGADRWRDIAVGLGVAALIFASLLVAAYSEGQYRLQARQSAAVQAQVLADTVSAALAFDDREALAEYVEAMARNPEIVTVGVYDAHGALAASFARRSGAERPAAVMGLAPPAAALVAVAPVIQKGSRLGTVVLRERTEPLQRRAARYMGPGLLGVMAVLMFVIMTLDARALRAANRALRRQIAEREKAEAALRQSQKMEAVGRLTGGIAHDFNNMLAIILGSLDLLLRRHHDADPKILRLATGAMEGAQRASTLTHRLLAFSRRQPLRPTSVDVGRAVRDISEVLRRTLGEAIDVEVVMAGGLWRAQIDLSELEAALLNLAINARDSMSGGGRLTIETGNTYLDRTYADGEDEVEAGQYVMVALTDTGAGIAPEILGQVFEPFFTTKAAGMGTGLGLSQVHGFIKQSHGHVRIYSEPGVGTTVKLYLPRSMDAPEEAPAERACTAATERRNTTVLVVEDEAGVRDFTVEALLELGYDVVSASGPAAALETLDTNPDVELMLTDVVMPGMNGRALADEARRRRPALRVVFMTGYTQNAIIHNGMLDPGTHLVSKPFTVAQLGAELEAAAGEARVAPPMGRR